MPDRRKRLLILGGVGALLVLVLAMQQLWPRGEESPVKTPLVAPTQPPAAMPPAPAAVSAAAAPEAYSKLLAISQQPSPQDLPVLKKAVQSPSWEDRHAAVMGIGRLKDKGDPATLLAVLANAQEKPEVRAEAAEQLAAMKYVDAGPAIMDAMADDSLLVRTAAGTALSSIMGMRFDYSPRDPGVKRQEAIARARNCWQRFYDEIQLRRSRGG